MIHVKKITLSVACTALAHFSHIAPMINTKTIHVLPAENRHYTMSPQQNLVIKCFRHIYTTMLCCLPCRKDSSETLSVLATVGNAKKMRAMINRGKVDVNGFDFVGNTPLIEAAGSDNAECLEILIEAHAQLDKPSRTNGDTALMAAINEQRWDHIQMLIQAGANPNIKNPKSHETALMIACQQKSIEGIEQLLKADNVDTTIKALNGKNACQIAQSLGRKECLRLINTYEEQQTKKRYAVKKHH